MEQQVFERGGVRSKPLDLRPRKIGVERRPSGRRQPNGGLKAAAPHYTGKRQTSLKRQTSQFSLCRFRLHKSRIPRRQSAKSYRTGSAASNTAKRSVIARAAFQSAVFRSLN